MWGWDAAFISIGLAHLNVDRAVRELETLLHAQWRTGMLRHIVFSDGTGTSPARTGGVPPCSTPTYREPVRSGIC